MADDQNFNAGIARIQTLIRQLETASDPAVRASVKELVQCMMDYHAAAVHRMMEVVDRSPESSTIIDSLGEDPLVRSLLVLYGLHPQSTAARVQQALEKLASTFRKCGADVELEWIEGSVVSLRISEVHSATVGRTLKDAIEEQIYTYAPDVTRVEGLNALGVSDLVAIGVGS